MIDIDGLVSAARDCPNRRFCRSTTTDRNGRKAGPELFRCRWTQTCTMRLSVPPWQDRELVVQMRGRLLGANENKEFPFAGSSHCSIRRGGKPSYVVPGRRNLLP